MFTRSTSIKISLGLNRRYINSKMHTIIQSFLLRLSRKIRHCQKRLGRYKHDAGSNEREDTFLTTSSNYYLQNIYNAWLKDKNSVDSSWNEFFQRIHSQKNNIRSALPKSNIATITSKTVPRQTKGGGPGENGNY